MGKLPSVVCQQMCMQQRVLNLGRNSVNIERFGGRVTAPMNRTTLGCLSLNIISICKMQYAQRVLKSSGELIVQRYHYHCLVTTYFTFKLFKGITCYILIHEFLHSNFLQYREIHFIKLNLQKKCQITIQSLQLTFQTTLMLLAQTTEVRDASLFLTLLLSVQSNGWTE